jgi:hypothetical protein
MRLANREYLWEQLVLGLQPKNAGSPIASPVRSLRKILNDDSGKVEFDCFNVVLLVVGVTILLDQRQYQRTKLPHLL